MTRIEARQFIEYRLFELWPKWEHNEAILTQWTEVISLLTPERAETAITRYYRSCGGRWRNPQLSEFNKVAQSLIPRDNTGDGRTPARRGPYCSPWFVVCVEHADTPSLVGTKKQLVFASAEPPAPEQQRAAAERDRCEWEALYGGKWVAIETELRPVLHKRRGQTEVTQVGVIPYTVDEAGEPMTMTAYCQRLRASKLKTVTGMRPEPTTVGEKEKRIDDASISFDDFVELANRLDGICPDAPSGKNVTQTTNGQRKLPSAMPCSAGTATSATGSKSTSFMA